MLKDTEMPHEISPMLLKLQAAREMGFDKDFEFGDGGLKCMQTGKVYGANELWIVDHFRFEGISNPDDMSILYLVASDDGHKGTVVDAFGTYGNSDLYEFMKKLKDRTKESL